MSTTYDRAPSDVEKRGRKLIDKYHFTLKDVNLKVDYAFARNDEGYAITVNGWPAYAKAKVVSLKDRALGRADCEIIIDANAWEGMTDKQQDALLDHELNHFELQRGKTGNVKHDSLGRPKVTIRQHDFQVGWFHLIAKRHGENSVEVQQARTLLAEDTRPIYFQGEFGFSTEGKSRIANLEVVGK